jgi:hypothetical protein
VGVRRNILDRLGRGKGEEDGVEFVLDVFEEFPSIQLQSGVREVGAKLGRMGHREGWKVVSAPSLVPLLLRESLGGLDREILHECLHSRLR